MRHLLYIIPTLLALWFVDQRISQDDYAGWNRNSVRNSIRRWANARDAVRRKTRDMEIALLGSSTSVDWLRPGYIAKLKGVDHRKVLDAHINGCHQTCTWSSVRLLLERGWHFKTAFFGTNQFQLCEYPHSKRILQHAAQMPSSGVPALFEVYASAEQPLLYMGRYLGNRVSGAYGDTEVPRKGLARAWFGNPRRGRDHLWYRTDRPKKGPDEVFCDYAPEHVAYKLAASEALLDDLGRLADHVYLLLLPDPTVSSDDPEKLEGWAKHRAAHQALAEARPNVTLVDLTVDGAQQRSQFRDSIHLNKAGMKVQQQRFEALMQANGYLSPSEGNRR
ncbi:MAG: hypothetical protein ACE366_10255 [Bradymonadia bacterium]